MRAASGYNPIQYQSPAGATARTSASGMRRPTDECARLRFSPMQIFFILPYNQYHGSLRDNMGSSFININVHLIFHTKSNGCTIREEDLSRVFHYIGGTIRSMAGPSYMVGGRPDHIHILASLPATIRLSDFVRDIKSNTSKWIKGINLYYSDFSWQEGYGAFSVSESNKDTVINYIANQKEHHRTHSSLEEFCQFLKKHGANVEEWLRRNSDSN